jgi:hypothetical protein
MPLYPDHALKSRTDLEVRIHSMEEELKALKEELENRREDDTSGWGFFDGAWHVWDSIDDAAAAYNERFNSIDGYYRLQKVYKIK